MQNNELKFLTQRDVAVRWSLSIRTLEGWRYKGVGPTYTKIRGRVLYPIEAIERLEAAGIMDGELDDE